MFNVEIINRLITFIHPQKIELIIIMPYCRTMKDFLKGVLEEDLYPPMIEYFQNKNYSIELEIPLYRNRVDMVAYNHEHLIAVELKLRNWKRALRQATYYQLGADLSYIAMPLHQAIEPYKRGKLLEREGVGLLAVVLNKSEVREVIKPKQSKRKVEYIERGIYSTIRRRC